MVVWESQSMQFRLSSRGILLNRSGETWWAEGNRVDDEVI